MLGERNRRSGKFHRDGKGTFNRKLELVKLRLTQSYGGYDDILTEKSGNKTFRVLHWGLYGKAEKIVYGWLPLTLGS